MQDWIFEQAEHTRGCSYPLGFRVAGCSCGIKPSGKPDLATVVADQPCDAAAVFTRNNIPGAPIVIGKRHVADAKLQAIIVNAGISNVATGKAGEEDAIAMCRHAADALGIEAGLVLPSSTGVIGVPLPMDKIAPGIATLLSRLDSGAEADAAAAEAILTTDLVRKLAATQIQLDGKPARIGAMAKGSGMIAPNMATMLCYITTDANIAPALLQQALTHAVNQSFNRISIDSDTSTSDTVAVLANGLAGNRRIESDDADYQTFLATLTALCRELAFQIVKDGEGVTRMMRVIVENAATLEDANTVAKTIIDSPLFKCALHGADPNWGRLVAALGRSGAGFATDQFAIRIGEITVGEHGRLQPLSPEQREQLQRTMRQTQVTLTITLNAGDASADWLGCDLSYDYVRINAEYTT